MNYQRQNITLLALKTLPLPENPSPGIVKASQHTALTYCTIAALLYVLILLPYD